MVSFPRGIEVVCGTIIENADKQIFLAQSPKWGKDCWCMPGGHVEPGETVAQASIREGEEETGLKLELVSIIGWGEAIADPEFHRPAHFIYFDAYCKVSNKINNDVKLDTRELTNYCWLDGIHQGVYGIPGLQMLPPSIRELVSKYAYEEAVQNVVSVAGYWRDPYQLDKYFNKSHFLPVINNEGNHYNETYRLNMLKLNSFIMVYSDIDEVVSPPKSSWLIGFEPNSLEAETWNQSRQFTENLIGMRTLWEQGKLFTFTCHTQHQDAQHGPHKDFFFKNILTFFNNTL